MTKKRDYSTIKSWSKVFFITLLIVFIVKSFIIDSFKISSSQMENSLLKGDYVIVNKLSYGIRMPITPLNIPFAFDSCFGLKSYSDIIQLRYLRFFKNKIEYNDVVLFNNPQDIEKPLDKRNLSIARCIASFGDTIRMKSGSFFINGKYYTAPFDLEMEYNFGINNLEKVDSVMKLHQIPGRYIKSDSVTYTLIQTQYNAFLINQALDTLSNLKLSSKELVGYNFQIPFVGLKIELSERNINIYKQTILNESSNIYVIDNKLYIDGKLQSHYTFTDNYYWLLSDNQFESVDSRFIGFISEKCIIGKVAHIYFSQYNNIIRWNRIFKSIN